MRNSLISNLIRWLKNWRFEIIAFSSGAGVMVLELAGSRMIAPVFGTSIYVWTAVIGVILAALLFGYWYGGKLADQGASSLILAKIFILSGLALSLCLTLQPIAFDIVQNLPGGLRLQALLAASLVYGPASIGMGMVSPYVLKLKLSNLKRTGRSAGNLYAASTLGSIFGTFLTGYWLISSFGSRAISWGVVVLLIGLALASYPKVILGNKIRWSLLMIAVCLIVANSLVTTKAGVIHEQAGHYNHYKVQELLMESQLGRFLVTDNQSLQSGISLDGQNRPILAYTRAFIDAAEYYQKPRRALLIGGGAFTVADYLVKQYPQLSVDTVEIDPTAYELGQRFFGVSQNPRLKPIFADARTYVNQAQDKYDIIYLDAFFSINPPFQLATREAIAQYRRLLNPEGVIVINLISSVEGPKNQFLASQLASYGEQFSHIRYFKVQKVFPSVMRSNIEMVVANDVQNFQSISDRIANYFNELQIAPGQVLTDDFAPVEAMTAD